jgi:hypothetical protein
MRGELPKSRCKRAKHPDLAVERRLASHRGSDSLVTEKGTEKRVSEEVERACAKPALPEQAAGEG